MSAKCPKCDALLPYIKVEHVDVRGPTMKWAGAAFVCPFCSVLLTVNIDQITVKDDTVIEVIDRLRKG